MHLTLRSLKLSILQKRLVRIITFSRYDLTSPLFKEKSLKKIPFGEQYESFGLYVFAVRTSSSELFVRLLCEINLLNLLPRSNYIYIYVRLLKS